MSKQNVNMEVPAHMVQQLQNFMEKLKVDEEVDEEEDDKCECFETHKSDANEVVGILDSRRIHKVQNWEFLIRFKDRSTEWISDENCNCEYLISQYLKQKGIKTAYLFCRVSTKEQATNTNTSLDAQESEMKKFAQDLVQFQRIKIYKISKSAYKSIPDILYAIGEAARENEGSGIFIWRVDRLSRNIVKYLSWLEDLNNNDVFIYSTSEKLCYRDNKLEFIQSIVNAQREAEVLGKRVKLSNKRKRERGDKAIGNLPFGKKYQRLLNDDGTTKYKIVVENKEELALVEIVRNMKKKKASWLVAQELNKKKKFKRGRKWSTSMVTKTK